MEERGLTVQRIAWSELNPFALILRTLPVAASFTVWSLAFIGVLLGPAGWLFLEVIFVGATDHQENPEFGVSVALHRSPYRGIFDADPLGTDPNEMAVAGGWSTGPWAVAMWTTEPFRQLFRKQSSWRHTAYWMGGGLWMLTWWSFIGCGIVRASLVRLARDEVLGVDEAAEFAFKKYRHAWLAWALPWIAIAVLIVPNWIGGWLMRGDVGLALVGVLWIFVLLIGIGVTLLLVGWFLGWPMALAAISADRISAVDGLARVYSFIFQRPVNCVCYTGLALAFGWLCWQGVAILASSTTRVALWSTSWSHGERLESRINTGNGDMGADAAAVDQRPAFWLGFGVSAMRFWNGAISALAVAFLYGHFWALASAVFLLLRRDVDQVELDEIYMSDDEQVYPLPPLVTDERGIPTIRPLVDDAPNHPDTSPHNE